MLTMLPKIALLICLGVFVFVCVKTFFFTKKSDLVEMSKLPLEDESTKG